MLILSDRSSLTARRHRRRPVSLRPRPRSPLSREIARLRAHFREVLGELRARDVASLSPAQRAARARLVGELERYARAGRFPRNRDFPGALVPYFVDAAGTRCAMAHLVESTGDLALVARIRSAKNNAFIRDLAGDGELVAWLDRAGITAAEAARIQPSYCFVTKADACFCMNGGSAGASAVVEATVISRIDASTAHIRVDAVHGDSSAATVGQEVDIMSSAEVGQKGLVTVDTNQLEGGVMYAFREFHLIAADGTLAVTCSVTVPPLKKADAINALLASAELDTNSISGCSKALAKVDTTWGASSCEDSGGCAISPMGGAPSVLFGALIVGVAAWSRRRARRIDRRHRDRRAAAPIAPR